MIIERINFHVSAKKLTNHEKMKKNCDFSWYNLALNKKKKVIPALTWSQTPASSTHTHTHTHTHTLFQVIKKKNLLHFNITPNVPCSNVLV